MSQPIHAPRLTSAEEIDKLKRDWRLYSEAIALYASIYLHLSRHKVSVHVEPVVKLEDSGRQKIPDLLLQSQNGWTLLEHKGSLPKDDGFLANKLESVSEYNQRIVFDKWSFQPEVVLLCPRKLAGDLMSRKEGKRMPTMISYSPPTERTCTLSVEKGSLSDNQIAGLFSDGGRQCRMQVDITERAPYKFIRREPPVPYTTHFVWGFISMYKDAFQKMVVVQYDNLVGKINEVCPPWCVQAKQFSEGRLNKAIAFLRQLGWIKYRSSTREITADTSRGTRVGKMEEYLCEKFVKFTVVTLEQEDRMKRRAGDLTLDRFFLPPHT